MIKKIEDYLTRPADTNPIQQGARTLKTELTLKFSYLGENNLDAIATYLDPRYKHKFFTPVTEEKIKEDILMIYNDTDIEVFSSPKKIRRTILTENYAEEQPGPAGLNNDLAIMMDSSSEDETEEKLENTRVVPKKVLLSYRAKKRINLYENPLQL